MKFRIIKEGILSYRAEVTENEEDWVRLNGHYFTRKGAKQECVRFADFCNGMKNDTINIVEEFKL